MSVGKYRENFLIKVKKYIKIIKKDKKTTITEALHLRRIIHMILRSGTI